MSALWPNQLLVSLSTENIAVIYRTFLTKRTINHRHHSFTEHSEQDWRVATQQLDNILVSLKLPTNTQLHLTLASDLVRYLTLPPQKEVMRQAEKLAYANAAYHEVYGVIAGNWLVKCHDAAPKQTTVATAIDQILFESIQELALKYKLKLKTMQPYLMRVFNRLDRYIDKSNAFLAIVEYNRLLLVKLQKGECQQIRSLKLSSDWQSMLNQMLYRETLLGDCDEREVLVYAPSQKNYTLDPAKNWHLKRINVTGKKINNELPYAMLETLA